METIISLLATAVSFLDVEIAKRKNQAAETSDLIDARHGISAVISLLRGDKDADARIEFVSQRRKDKVKNG